MSKVSLTLVGVKANAVEKETKKALSELYSMPEYHFEIHCRHLFELKEPYQLIKQIDAGEAELHREKLEQMGIVCEVAALSGSGGLSVFPVDAKETDDTSPCSAREHTVGRSHDEDENPPTVVEDKGKNKILYMAAACTFFAAIGGGYFVHSLSQASLEEEVDFSIADSATPSVEETTGQPQTLATVKNTAAAGATPYSVWQDRMASIDELKNQLGVLNETAGLASAMSDLLANTEYPMDRIVGNHHVVKLKFEKQRSAVRSDNQDSSSLELQNELDNSLLLIAALPSAVERLCALLDLGKTLESLNLSDKAGVAYRQAEKAALDVMNSKDPSQVVLGEVIAAEHLVDREQYGKGRVHYASAIDAARLDELNSYRAMAFVVRSQARVGMFADAYALVDEIQDEQIKTVAMDGIARISDQLEFDPQFMSMDLDE